MIVAVVVVVAAVAIREASNQLPHDSQQSKLLTELLPATDVFVASASVTEAAVASRSHRRRQFIAVESMHEGRRKQFRFCVHCVPRISVVSSTFGRKYIGLSLEFASGPSVKTTVAIAIIIIIISSSSITIVIIIIIIVDMGIVVVIVISSTKVFQLEWRWLSKWSREWNIYSS